MEGHARVVVEFADSDTAMACYRSAEYQKAKTIRQQYAMLTSSSSKAPEISQPKPVALPWIARGAFHRSLVPALVMASHRGRKVSAAGRKSWN
jgi:hypothetical protein